MIKLKQIEKRFMEMQYDESILENEDTSWAEEILNKDKLMLRSLTAEEIEEIMSLHNELKNNCFSRLNKLERYSEFEQLRSFINVFTLELSNLSKTKQSSGFSIWVT